MLILIAVCIPILIVMAVFAVDVAYMELVRTELRSSTDAAARAGTRKLSLTQSAAQARSAAKDAAQRNKVSGTGLLLA
ncbi:MAG: pilus assembly protein TadG-related protein, partial [Pirellulales bacterium]